MMLRLANDAQHDVRPAKTASGASEREGGLRGLDSRPKTSEKEGGRNKVHNTMICSEIKTWDGWERNWNVVTIRLALLYSHHLTVEI